MGDAQAVTSPGTEERMEIAALVPDKRNARKHNRHNVEAIAASLQRFGQRTKLVVRRNGMVVLKGNGTLAAAKMLGWEHLDCLLVDDDAKTGTAYAIADNRTAELAEWDEKVLDHALAEVGPELAAIAWPGTDDGDDESDDIEINDVDVSDADAVFTIVVSGRLRDQPMVLEALRDALDGKAADLTADVSVA